MKVFIEILDTKSFVYQTGMIDEPVQKGFELANAIAHFGLNSNSIEWEEKSNLHRFGKVIGTSKVVSIITPENATEV